MEALSREMLLISRSCSPLVESLLAAGCNRFCIYLNRSQVGMLSPVVYHGFAQNSFPPLWYRDCDAKPPINRLPDISTWLADPKPQFIQNPPMDGFKALRSSAGCAVIALPIRGKFSAATSATVGVIVTPGSDESGATRRLATKLAASLQDVIDACATRITNTLLEHKTILYRKTIVRVTQFADNVMRQDVSGVEVAQAQMHPRGDSEDYSIRLANYFKNRRRMLGLTISQQLSKYFRLSRCIVLVSSPADPNVWEVVGSRGLSPDQKKTPYLAMMGLTGLTLACKQPTDIIASASIEEDSRWSRRYGDQFQRNQRETTAGTRIAFVGIPFFSRVREGEKSAYGAIIAMRPHDPLHGDPGPFSKSEKHILQLAATAAAHGFDTLRWRESLATAATWQLDLARLWGASLPDDIVFQRLLKTFHTHILPGRLLLAVRDRDREQISGRAVFGGFSKRLIQDTVRKIFRDPPTDESREDILARVCRDGLTEPKVVDPKSETDTWSLSIDSTTRIRHGVDQSIVLVPIPDRAGTVQAVILGEIPLIAAFNQQDCLREMRVFAQHSTALMEFLALDAENRRRRRLIDQMDALTSYVMSSSTDHSALLRQMTALIGFEFGFSQAVFYRYDPQSGVLEGVFGLGVDGNEVRSTVYPVRGSDPHTKKRPSLAAHVFHTSSHVYVECMCDRLVDQDDRSRVGIDSDSCGYGIPLTHDERVEGVLILCWKPATTPPAHLTSSCQRTLGILSHYLGLILSVQRQLRDSRLPQRANNAKDLILAQVSRLAVLLQSAAIDGERSVRFSPGALELLQSIVTEISSVFQANVSGLFLAAKPVFVSTETSVASGLWGQDAYETRFKLVAGVGYKEEVFDGSAHSLSYSPYENGLTSTVLRTMQSTISRDVEADPRWSKRGVYKLATLQCPFRTWLGVPIAFRTGEGVYLFGALTCTRCRRVGDSREFTTDDTSVAQSISDLLSLALYSQELVSRERRSMDQFLMLFRHEDMFVVFESAKYHAYKIEELSTLDNEHGAIAARQEISRHAAAIQGIVQFVGLITDAYTAYARRVSERDCEWSCVGDTGVTRVLKTVIGFCDAIAVPRGVAISVTLEDIEGDLGVASIDEGKTAYILYAFIRNALKSIERSGRVGGAVAVSLRRSGEASVNLSVRDNGVGLDPNDEITRNNLFIKGFSGFSGSGLGLAIVAHLLESHWGQGKHGVTINGVVGEWASFTAVVPAVFIRRN